MKIETVLFAFFICLIACKKEEGDIVKQSSKGIIKGSITYNDVLTGQVVLSNDAIVTELTSIEAFYSFPTWIQTKSTGSKYEFGPLLSGSYLIKSEFTDPVLNLKYSANLSVTGDTNKPVINDIILMPNYNYTLLCLVKDSLGNPMANAKVYLYNNYDFLVTYKDAVGAAVSTGITNSWGRVVFNNLTAVPYFIYSTRIMGSDTLNSLDTTFNPTTQPALIMSSLNTITSIVK